MIITKQRIRSLKNYLPAKTAGSEIVIGVKVADVDGAALAKAGFSAHPELGDQVLPPADTGATSRRNAEGDWEIHRDQPMETAYTQIEWTWQEYHGRDTMERSDIRDRPYQRYPRTFIPPQSLEFSVVNTTAGDPLVVLDPITYEPADEQLAVHAVNLALEAFGFCEVFTENLETILTAPIRRLNWRVLPPGVRPWEQLKEEVAQVVRHAPPGNRAVVEYRLETVNSYRPAFVAVGEAGFRGYLIFGFPDRACYILESTEVNNATYVLGSAWEELSQLTKAQLLADELHEARIVHRDGWAEHIRRILRPAA